MSENLNVGDEEFGAGLPWVDKIQLAVEWAPVITRLQAIADAKTPEERALACVKALEWLAGKTTTTVDDEALEHLEAVLKSPEGAAFFDWVVAKVTKK
jgi:hypothetical protein